MILPFLAAHWLDLTTTLLGLAYILLEYRASRLMWVVGLAMQVLGVVLYYEKGLYADCGMEFYYIAMTVYGFLAWRSAQTKGAPDAPTRRERPVTRIPLRTAAVWSLLTLALWALIWWILATKTDSTVPVADSFTTALSMAGMWALARKYLEQWFIWIAVDAVTCALYFHKDIPFKASLYGLYVVIAVAGYLRWRRLMREAATAARA